LEVQAFLPVLAKSLVAGMFTCIGLFIYRAGRNPRTPKGNAVLLDLGSASSR